MTKPKRLLKELEISEISLVDNGANEGAKVVLFKRGISKSMHGPSDMLGVQLLRVLMTRVENVRLGSEINRLEAWVQVLGSEEGQQLLALVTKGDQSVFQGAGEEDVAELADFLEGPDGGAFLKAFSKQIKEGLIVPKEMETVEKILKKSESRIEAMNSLKLELTKMAKAGDRRTPEKLLVDFLDGHSEIESAILELPNVAKVEVQEQRNFGPTHTKIQKKIDELISNGEVSSRAKGFMKVVDSDPQLMAEYLKEQI